MFIHKTSIVEDKKKIGKNVKIWHWTHICKNVEIGEGTTIGQNCYIGPNVKIGKNVKIQNNVSVYEGVEIKNDVFCGPSMVFTNVINPRSSVNRKNEFRKTIVEEGCTIGANATIICGNRLGAHSLIGAGSVVTKSINSFSCVIGNPAKHKYWISIGGQKLNFGKRKTIKQNNVSYFFHRGKLIAKYKK